MYVLLVGEKGYDFDHFKDNGSRQTVFVVSQPKTNHNETI
jgi:hypothetical protein